MPCTDSTLSPDLREAMDVIVAIASERGGPLADLERRLQAAFGQVGRVVLKERLQSMTPQQAFVEEGTRWKPAVVSVLDVVTVFGVVKVRRPLFRSTRNGPTRCVVSEQCGLIAGSWTPTAARIAAEGAAEMPFDRLESFLREAHVVQASRSSLLRLVSALSDAWEEQREANEEFVRHETPIPPETALAAFSLDGVMIMMTSSDKATKKARTRAAGRADKGPAGFKEAAVAAVSFYETNGQRLETRRYARMPEHDKTTVKSWLAAEFARVRRDRPDVKTLAIADGAANNWSFLETLGADYELVDFFHAVEHLHVHVNKATVASSLETQSTVAAMRRLLRDESGGAARVFADLQRIREAAGTAAPSTLKTSGRRQPTFFERHKDRMDFAAAKSANVPIGSGVTESTCKLTVCDRLRRTGMHWSPRGGQAVMTLRALATSDQFNQGWTRMARVASERRAA